jgi:hypothetical protein
MSLKLVAVQGMTVIVDQGSVVPPGSGIVATVVAKVPTGTKVKAEAKLVHRDGDQIDVSAITAVNAGATIPDPGPYTVALNKTVQYVKAEGIEVLVEGDVSDTVFATPQIPGSPPTDYPVSFKCVIQVAGQTKVKAQ